MNLRFEASRGGGGGGGKRIFGEESTRGITEGQVKDDGVADVKISKGGDTGGMELRGGEVSYVDETRYTGMNGNED